MPPTITKANDTELTGTPNAPNKPKPRTGSEHKPGHIFQKLNTTFGNGQVNVREKKMKRPILILTLLLICRLPAVAAEPYQYSIRQRQDTSVNAAKRMVYRLHLETQSLPDQDRMKATAEQVWRDGNRHWNEFTVFMIFGPIQDFNAGAYGIAEFSPSGLRNFQINRVPLSMLELSGIPVPTPESKTQLPPPADPKDPDPKIDPFATRFDEITTRDGRTFRRVAPQRIEDGSLVCFHSSGIEHIPLRNLPDDFRKLFDLPSLDTQGRQQQAPSTTARPNTPQTSGRVDASALRTGQNVIISKETPLMPAFEPADPFAAMSATRRLPSGTVIRILEIRSKRGTPWYRVTAFDRNQSQIGSGWINSTALLGQTLVSQ